nr:hypothetical protein [Brevundimonas sp. UBA7534]
MHLAGDRRQRSPFQFRSPEQAGGFGRQIRKNQREATERLGKLVIRGVPPVAGRLGAQRLCQPRPGRVAAIAVEQGVAKRDPEPGVHLAGIGEPAGRQRGLEGELLQDIFGVFVRPQPFEEVTKVRRAIVAQAALDKASNLGRRCRAGGQSGGDGSYSLVTRRDGALQAHGPSPA